jgi:hypothetical protein
MSNPRFIKLRNGVLFRLEDVRLISRKDLNQYNVVLDGLPMAPQADGYDVAFLETQMEVLTTPTPLRIEEPTSKLQLAE